MHRLVVFVLLLFIGTSLHAAQAIAQQSASSDAAFMGAWKLVSARTPEGLVADSLMREQLKIVTPTHFAVVVQKEEGDSLGVAHAGTYTLNGDTYVEKYQYSTLPDYPPSQNTFKWQIEDDNWHITCVDGCYTQWTQTWRRVK